MSPDPTTQPAAAELEQAIDQATQKVLVQTRALPELGDGKASGPFPLASLMDVQVKVSVEIGRTRLTLGELSKLGPGSVVELDRELHEPADILANGKIVARGEIVTVGNRYGVRITQLEKP